MKFDNILSAICSFPAIVLDVIVTGARKLILEEKEVLQGAEYDPEADITD